MSSVPSLEPEVPGPGQGGASETGTPRRGDSSLSEKMKTSFFFLLLPPCVTVASTHLGRRKRRPGAGEEDSELSLRSMGHVERLKAEE